jgi:hypothetical protein
MTYINILPPSVEDPPMEEQFHPAKPITDQKRRATNYAKQTQFTQYDIRNTQYENMQNEPNSTTQYEIREQK